MSRHHILPPVVYTPASPKPKKTERRRGVGQLKGKGALDEAEETEETGEISHTAPTRGAAALPQHQMPIEGAKRRILPTTGKLSEDTLKAMLEVQEHEGTLSAGGVTPLAKE